MNRLSALLIALRLPADERSLKQKVMISGSLSAVGFITVAFLRLASTIVLTRILTPDTFGIFSVLLTFVFILTMFSDLGIRSLILTKEGTLEDEFLHSCWTIQILRGVVIAVVILIVAGTIAVLQGYDVFLPETSYAAPVLPPAIAAMALSFLILGTEYPNKFVYERRMRFGMITIEEMCLAFLQLVFMIGLALYLRNIWALVLGLIASSAIQVTLSYFLFEGPKMRLAWHRDHIAVIFERGKWIIVHSALTAITNVADRLVLGMFIPASTFGFYHIARQLIEMPVMLLTKIHTQVGLQLFTEIHKYEAVYDFRQRYYRYRKFFDALAMLGCGALLVLAPILVEIVYDDRYASVAGILQILALGLPLTGFTFLREAFSAQRRFRKMTVLSIVQAATIWIGLLLALPVFNSMTAAFFIVSLHRVPEILVLLYMGHKERWVEPLKEIQLLPLIAVGAALGWALDWLLRAAFFAGA